MIFEPHISYDSLVVLFMGFMGAIGGYYGIIRRVDRLADRHSVTERTVQDLRRGRGLILGGDSDWPDAVRRCFGFGTHGTSRVDSNRN